MFNRTLAIQELVDNDFSDIFNLGESEGSMLESILMHGFKGYNNFTDNELMYELEDLQKILSHDKNFSKISGLRY